uniref:Uncharacterized protein n=1 Tax=Cyprinus carpio TaxID=7962 RepID=A0A8C2BRG4_CYPCA
QLFCFRNSDQDEAHPGPSCPAGSYADPNTVAKDGATAPPADMMPVVPGYESLGPYVIPPSDFGPTQPQAPSRAPERRFDIPAITEELAQEAFIKYASSKCCYSSKPAKEMVFTDLQSLNTYRYRLETFTESRTTEWDSEPYNGEKPSGCHSCLNLGRSACRRCVNSGRTQCAYCGGMGRTGSNRCSPCHGSGMTRCHSCGGVGSITCTTCKGQGKLLCFIKLKITWKNNVYVAVIDKGSGFPVELLDRISGEKLLTDMAPMVYPVVSFPDSSVNAESESAVREHQAQFATTCRILQQRQTIELIPITRVHYVWNEKTHIYFVYGTEHKVYTKDYPVKCCCCSIL